MKKIIVSILLILIIASVAAVQVLRAPKKAEVATTQRTTEITPVVVAEVIPGIFSDRIEALGTTAANESVVITADVMGRVVSINFSDGERVKKGNTLVVLDSDEEKASMLAAEVNLTTQKTQHKRLEELIRQKSAAQTTLDEQTNSMKRADADLEIARVHMQDRTVQAPFSGQLGIRRVSLGALINPGDEIVTLDDLSLIKLDFSVPETVLSSLEPGLDIQAASVAYPDQPFTGKVTTIDTRIDPVTRTVVVRAELPNTNGLLKPGMLLTVDLKSNSRESLQIPEESLLPLNNKQFVYLVNEDSRVRQVEVKIGRRQPGVVEILDGLTAGDRVVTEGTTRVTPDSQVQIVRSSDSSRQELPADAITETDARISAARGASSQNTANQ